MSAEAPACAVGAKADFHVHLKGDLTLDDALRKSRDTGIYYGIVINGGLTFPINSDAGLEAFLQEMRGKPVYVAFQAEGREWVRLFTKPTLEKFDYVFTDAMTWTDDGGKRMRLWIKEDVGAIADPQAFMDTLVKRATGIFDRRAHRPLRQPDVPARGDRGGLRPALDARADEGHRGRPGPERHRDGDQQPLPHPSAAFIRLAKQAGVKFACGTNNTGAADLGRERVLHPDDRGVRPGPRRLLEPAGGGPEGRAAPAAPEVGPGRSAA